MVLKRKNATNSKNIGRNDLINIADRNYSCLVSPIKETVNAEFFLTLY